MSIQLLETRLPDILANHPRVVLVYLFGSQATGHAGPMSDYDVGVLVDREETTHSSNTERTCARLAHELADALDTDQIGQIFEVAIQ